MVTKDQPEVSNQYKQAITIISFLVWKKSIMKYACTCTCNMQPFLLRLFRLALGLG